MAKLVQKVSKYDASRKKRKKTSIGASHNTRRNKYRGQGK